MEIETVKKCHSVHSVFQKKYMHIKVSRHQLRSRGRKYPRPSYRAAAAQPLYVAYRPRSLSRRRGRGNLKRAAFSETGFEPRERKTFRLEELDARGAQAQHSRKLPPFHYYSERSSRRVGLFVS